MTQVVTLLPFTYSAAPVDAFQADQDLLSAIPVLGGAKFAAIVALRHMIRQDLHLTREELAQAIGVDAKTLSRWLKRDVTLRHYLEETTIKQGTEIRYVYRVAMDTPQFAMQLQGQTILPFMPLTSPSGTVVSKLEWGQKIPVVARPTLPPRACSIGVGIRQGGVHRKPSSISARADQDLDLIPIQTTIDYNNQEIGSDLLIAQNYVTADDPQSHESDLITNHPYYSAQALASEPDRATEPEKWLGWHFAYEFFSPIHPEGGHDPHEFDLTETDYAEIAAVAVVVNLTKRQADQKLSQVIQRVRGYSQQTTIRNPRSYFLQAYRDACAPPAQKRPRDSAGVSYSQKASAASPNVEYPL